MFYFFTAVMLICYPAHVESACEDLVSPTSITTVSDGNGNFKENVTSCARIVECYPGLCETMGRENGRCCQACKAAGTPTCLNKASTCSPVYIIPADKPKIEITSCATIVSDYPAFCARNRFGGKKNSCCKACSEASETSSSTESTTTGPAPETSTTGSAAETTTTGPVPETSTTGPAIETSTTAPATETTTTAPATETTTTAPATETSTTAPATETSTSTAMEISECTDSITETYWLDALDEDRNFKERLTSCDRLIACYPGLCRLVGGPGGRCCQSCKKVGDPDCLNSASLCNPVYVIPGGKDKNKIEIPSCNIIVNDYSMFCKDDAFGGQGNACCKACNEAPNPAPEIPCIDSTTWKLGKGKKAKTCAQLAKKAKKMKSCCKKNKKTQGTPIRCRAACCASCAKYL